MKNLLLLLLVSVLLNGCKNNDEILTEKEVFAVIDKFDEGWKNKKADLVDSVLSEHYVYFTQSGQTFNRPNLISTAGSDIYKLQTMERENFTIMLEGNTAVVNTIWKGKGFYHGEQFNDKQRCSITIVKHKGVVKILAEHCTPIK
jgi:outer membrane lipoprotein-sorting protein